MLITVEARPRLTVPSRSECGRISHRNSGVFIMSVLHRAAALRLLVGIALGAFSLVAASLPAVAATNVNISGVVLDADGAPVPNFRVGNTATMSQGITNETGHFEFPVAAGATVSLTLAPGYGPGPVSSSPSGALSLTTAPMTFDTDRNLGALTLPRMREGAVKVLDKNGVPVYGANISGSTRLSTGWLDNGHPLTGTDRPDRLLVRRRGNRRERTPQRPLPENGRRSPPDTPSVDHHLHRRHLQRRPQRRRRNRPATR